MTAEMSVQGMASRGVAGRHAARRSPAARRGPVGRHASRRQRPGLRSATAWSYGLTLGKMSMTTALSLVLAAMLGPRAFGVIAMALVFTNFIEMLQQQGMMPAIIARKTLRDEHSDTAFWMVVGAGVLCTVAGLLVAPWWAGLNDLPELTPVIQVLALGVPLTSTVVVHEAILRRNMEFKKLAIRSWCSVLAGGVAGIGGAVLGWGVWALVAQQLVMSVTTVAVLWGVSSWRPRLHFSRPAAGELWSYSLRSSSSSLGLFLGGRVDVILAGALFGPVLVGLYRLGQRLTAMVVDVTARSMQSVSLPGLAELQNDPDGFEIRLLRMQRITACLALPTLGVLVGIAPVVEHILGDEWAGTTTAIRILAIAQAVSAVSLLLGPALQARGRPGRLAVIMWVWTGLTAAALVSAATLDLPGGEGGRLASLCLAIVVASGVSALILMVVASRTFAIPFGKMLRAWAPGLAAGLSAALVASAVASWHAVNPLVTAGLAAAIGSLVALAILMLLDPLVRTSVRDLPMLRHLSGAIRSVSLDRVTERSQDHQPTTTRTNRGS